MAEIGKKLGFSWGGNWKSLKDYPHLEMIFGLSIDDYQEETPETEETENDKLNLTDNQWKMTVNAIQG